MARLLRCRSEKANYAGQKKTLLASGATFSTIREHHGSPDRFTAWPEFFWNQPSIQDTTHITLDPVTYLGAAATLFITAECMNSRVLLYDGPERFGLLSHAYPYVEQRWHIEAGQELPDLPVPEEIKPLFHKWAGEESQLCKKLRIRFY